MASFPDEPHQRGAAFGDSAGQGHPRNAAAHNTVGNALHKRDQFTEAIRQFVLAIILQPDFSFPYNNLSSSLLPCERAVEAVSSDRRLLAHCGLPWNEACLAFHRTERLVRTASAAQVRQPLYRSAMGRWHVYREMAQPLLDALGLPTGGS